MVQNLNVVGMAIADQSDGKLKHVETERNFDIELVDATHHRHALSLYLKSTAHQQDSTTKERIKEVRIHKFRSIFFNYEPLT